MILFDTPPIIAVTDAVVLSLLLDGVVLVACAGQTSQQGLARAKSLLDNVDAKVMGVVLNKTDVKSAFASYHYYYHYHYSGDGEEKSKTKAGKMIKQIPETVERSDERQPAYVS
jgi:Mrp family chromosome partitioning ATPase